MSDSENNNNPVDKLDNAESQRHQASSPNNIRFGNRKRPASADLEAEDIIEESEEELHFKRRHPSAEILSERNNYDYLPHNSSGNSAEVLLDTGSSAGGHQRASPSSIKEEISLKDISMLRNPEDQHLESRSNIKREKY